jgi:hypothetical protein
MVVQHDRLPVLFCAKKQTRHLKPSQVAGELGPKLGLVYFTNTSSQTRASAQAQQQIFIALGSNKFISELKVHWRVELCQTVQFWDSGSCGTGALAGVFLPNEITGEAPVPHK